ncbi:MAG: cytochrome c oxidase assembly protein, partial [Gammaproteobacteria bacterium]|nr:cytochrome c oxidase assembly protein [Gammaproteobacteria bacterium]
MNDRTACNRRLTLRLLGFAAGAFAFGFALVPLYDVL